MIKSDRVTSEPRTGRPLNLTPEVAEAVRRKLLEKSRPDGSGCRLWHTRRHRVRRELYGTIYIAPYIVKAPRAAFAAWKAPIPAGRVVMHTCDVPACVEPSHLRLGTQGDNMRDRDAKGRARHGGADASKRARLLALMAEGISQHAAARRIGVSQPAVCLMLRRIREARSAPTSPAVLEGQSPIGDSSPEPSGAAIVPDMPTAGPVSDCPVGAQDTKAPGAVADPSADDDGGPG